MYTMVDGRDSVDQRACSMPNHHTLPIILQFSGGICKVTGMNAHKITYVLQGFATDCPVIYSIGEC